MSLYPGPTIAQDYAHGRDQGYTEGEHDRFHFGFDSDTCRNIRFNETRREEVVMNIKSMSPEQRRKLYARYAREALHSMTPTCDGNRYSGGQIAAAKGIATKRMLREGA